MNRVQMLALSSLLTIAPIAADASPLPWTTTATINLGGSGFDFDYDASRSMLYVSIPDRNEIVYVSTATGSIVNRHFVGSRPLGVDYAPHADRVFVALNQAAAIASVHPATSAVNEIVVGGTPGTGNSLIYDVVEARPNEVFVSASPSSSGFARIAKVDLANGNQITTVANNRIIRAQPTFQQSTAGNFLYVGESFSPNSLYKLDITQSTAPIVLEDDHGSISGTRYMDISPDGSRYYLSSGQVLRTDSFLQAGAIGNGIPRLNDDGSRAYVLDGALELWNTQTFQQIDSFDLPAGFTSSIEQMDLLPNGGGLVILNDSQLFIAVPEPMSALMLAGLAMLTRYRRVA